MHGLLRINLPQKKSVASQHRIPPLRMRNGLKPVEKQSPKACRLQSHAAQSSRVPGYLLPARTHCPPTASTTIVRRTRTATAPHAPCVQRICSRLQHKSCLAHCLCSSAFIQRSVVTARWLAADGAAQRCCRWARVPAIRGHTSIWCS